jgi:SAM-dependent methyltransferase
MLDPLLKQYIQPDASVIDIGCGNSDLLGDMLHDGHEGELVGIDYIPSVIKEQRSRYKASAEIRFEEMDARDLKYDAHSFGAVLEKGLLDALLSGEDGNNKLGASDIFAAYKEIGRVLKPGGVMVMITLVNPNHEDASQSGLTYLQDIVLVALQSGSEAGAEEEASGIGEAQELRVPVRWAVEIHSIEGASSSTETLKNSFHVYAIRKVEQKRTRSTSQGTSQPVTIKQFMHDMSEGDEDEDEDEEGGGREEE